MSAEFGPRLRQERERRKISLASISANTKVSISLFEALERDDVSRWPSGIFRRSFVRAYATAIGLDAEDVVREFLERFPDPAEKAAESHEARRTDRRFAFERAAGLRLTLADTPQPFIGGRVLAALKRRSTAVALDAAVNLAVAALLVLAFDAFWAPLTVFMACYYWGGILLLGNTPGVCLQAPTDGRGNSGPRFPFRFPPLSKIIRARFLTRAAELQTTGVD
jgi:transcriptional regulator with XRE-family HTH domain